MARTEMGIIAGSAPGQRLVVGLDQTGRDGRLQVTLTEQHLADGIGWFDQRSMHLDSRQWGQLRALFAGVADAIRDDEAYAPPATLAFPSRVANDEDALNQHVG